MLQAAGAWSRHYVSTFLVCTVRTRTAVATEASRLAALVTSGSLRQLVAAEMFGCSQRSGLPKSAGAGSPAPPGVAQSACEAGHTPWPAASIPANCSQSYHPPTVSHEGRHAGAQPSRRPGGRRLAATATFSTASRGRGAGTGLSEEADVTAAIPSVRKVRPTSAAIAAQAPTASHPHVSPADATEAVQCDQSFAQALPEEAEQNPTHSVAVNFVSDGVLTMAAPGDNLWTVAEKCAFPTMLHTGLHMMHAPARFAGEFHATPCLAPAPAQTDQIMKSTRQ